MATLACAAPIRSRRDAGTLLAGRGRRFASAVAAATLVAALVLDGSKRLALLGNSKTGESGERDDSFLRAVANGDTGQGLVSRLQDVWFVETFRSGRPELTPAGRDATELAGSLLSAGFPEEMKRAIDVSVNPCDDMYQFACGRYPFDRFPGGATGVAQEKQRDVLERILQNDTGAPGVYYRSCGNAEAVEAVGDSVLMPWLAYFDSVSDKSSFVRAVTELNKLNLDTFFSWWIDQDTRDSTRQAMTILQAGCTMPDDLYYLEDSPTMQKHRDTMLAMVTKFFTLVGRTNAGAEAKMVLDFETAQARIHVSRTEAHGDEGEAADLSRLEQLMPYWPWKEWLQQLGLCTAPPQGCGSDMLCNNDYHTVWSVGQPGGTPLEIRNAPYLSRLNALLIRTDLETLKAILRWRVIFAWSRYMSSPFLDLTVKWMDGGDTAPRNSRCVESSCDDVAWPMSKLYVDRVFQAPNRDATLQMLEVMRTRLLDALPNENWMVPSDRVSAEKKLRAMFFQVAFPTDRQGAPYWPLQATILDGRLREDAYLSNYILTQRLQIDTYFRTLEKGKVDRFAWGVPQGQSPLRTNAFYDARQNGLFVAAGILQAPFIRNRGSHLEARNFGAIGAILGHEMSHGFDDSGRQYNDKGELREWWSQKTVSNYRNLSSCYTSVFDSYRVLGRAVNGAYTLNENLADAGGLKFAYSAFKHQQDPSAVDERVFFTAFAQMYCKTETKKEAEQELLSDPHAPNKFRVLGTLSQFKPFANAFYCPAGSPMAPLSHCELWHMN